MKTYRQLIAELSFSAKSSQVAFRKWVVPHAAKAWKQPAWKHSTPSVAKQVPKWVKRLAYGSVALGDDAAILGTAAYRRKRRNMSEESLQEISKWKALKHLGQASYDMKRLKIRNLSFSPSEHPSKVEDAWRASKRNMGTQRAIFKIVGIKPKAAKRLEKFNIDSRGRSTKEFIAQKMGFHFGVDPKTILSYTKKSR